MDLNKTIRNLESRGFTVRHFASGAEAADYLTEAVQNTTVGIGGSKTIDQLGLYDRLLERGNTVYWHWREPGTPTRDKATAAPVYFSSANAISENGEIVNIDGTGNRVAAQVYGQKKLYIVAGTNKICPDLESAIYRARNTAAVQNAQRFPKLKTPCKIDGKCHDCRIRGVCNALVILMKPVNDMDVEIVLIDEELGL